ncbi:hypothetical protein CDAR_422131 [Caerostris darwini]|uniref:Uncharacterized protein n=1 Tax=Caerostris darwini TaxID=1538125 RepID=A0AAV4WT68_9ARAC|nr:hypothetical protein CDAR_422131 [Caerostris darwini]
MTTKPSYQLYVDSLQEVVSQGITTKFIIEHAPGWKSLDEVDVGINSLNATLGWHCKSVTRTGFQLDMQTSCLPGS